MLPNIPKNHGRTHNSYEKGEYTFIVLPQYSIIFSFYYIEDNFKKNKNKRRVLKSNLAKKRNHHTCYCL